MVEATMGKKNLERLINKTILAFLVPFSTVNPVKAELQPVTRAIATEDISSISPNADLDPKMSLDGNATFYHTQSSVPSYSVLKMIQAEVRGVKEIYRLEGGEILRYYPSASGERIAVETQLGAEHRWFILDINAGEKNEDNNGYA